jgi:hypothetical protein
MRDEEKEFIGVVHAGHCALIRLLREDEIHELFVGYLQAGIQATGDQRALCTIILSLVGEVLAQRAQHGKLVIDPEMRAFVERIKANLIAQRKAANAQNN